MSINYVVFKCLPLTREFSGLCYELNFDYIRANLGVLIIIIMDICFRLKNTIYKVDSLILNTYVDVSKSPRSSLHSFEIHACMYLEWENFIVLFYMKTNFTKVDMIYIPIFKKNKKKICSLFQSNFYIYV